MSRSARSLRVRGPATPLAARLLLVVAALFVAACAPADNDRDGFTQDDGDCNDTSSAIFPHATEVCDRLDNDCDGQVDEDLEIPSWYLDLDGDGYGAAEGVTACQQPTGYIARSGDCDDASGDVNPAAAEVCDDIDNDCDGQIDEAPDTGSALPGSPTWYADADGDGFGDLEVTVVVCQQPQGYSSLSGDCDDSTDLAYPGAAEICDARDNDCDGQVDEGFNPPTWYPDQDLDGYGDASAGQVACQQPSGYIATGGDCDDADATISPAALEVCDTTDNNCDGQIDEGLETSPWYPDQDGDGYGADGGAVDVCAAPEGYIATGGDCNDADGAVSPASLELCDGIDNDCSGQADDGLTFSTWYPDQDGDGYGAAEGALEACQQPDAYVDTDGDCDDADPALNPAALEVCDAIDNDCSGQIDEDLPRTTWYQDTDGDGYGQDEGAFDDCRQPEGYVDAAGDCADDDFAISPEAAELCDGRDNDCNGHIDDGLGPLYYADQDGDGFGDPDASSCTPADGYLQVRGDCDDRDPDVHAGAPDPADDGLDRDCGGTDAQEPSVGLEASGFTAIQDALEAAADGTTVWVGPGSYLEHDLDFHGAAVTLASSHFAGETTLDAAGTGRLMAFTSNEGPDTVVDGFTLTGGRVGSGGAMYMSLSSPTLANLVITGNQATGSAYTYGGALYLDGSSPTLSFCVLSGNTAAGSSAGSGGAVYARSGSSPRFTRCTITGNSVSGAFNSSGGGLFLSASSPTLERCTIAGNQATYGGGLYLDAASPAVENTIVAGNTASSQGGGVYLYNGSSPAFNADTLVGNAATGTGGGLYLSGTSSRPTLTDTIVALNVGYNLFNSTSTPASPALTACDLYAPTGPDHNLTSIDGSNLSLAPGFVRYSKNGDWTDDDLHLAPDSPLVDAGDPALQDPDGSVADLGAYGGRGADTSYALDTDTDGMADGWETAWGLQVGIDDDGGDPDGDGASNLEEFLASSAPDAADTDGDGTEDGAEIDAGSDPTDWYSQPGLETSVVARVPEDFASIQAAIDAVDETGTIEVGAGTWAESVRLELKQVTLTGAGVEETVIEGQGTSVVTGYQADLTLSGLTLTGGDAVYGGGLYLSWSGGELSDLAVAGNTATRGGGLYLSGSSPDLTRLEAADNTATLGGGLYLSSSSPAMTAVVLMGNLASDDGGGLYAKSGSSPTLSSCTFSSNEAGDEGGGIYLNGTSISLTNTRLSDNLADVGGGMALDSSSPTLTNCALDGNAATTLGGGMWLDGSSPAITNCVLTGNSAGAGGGLYLTDSTTRPVITNTILAYNSGYNLYNDTSSPASPTLAYTDLYSPGGQANHNLSSIGATGTTAEPGFLAYEGGLPVDLHLSLSSALTDAGDPNLRDPEGSSSDFGCYGGPYGDGWDLDADGYRDWFWPGTIDQAPAGIDPSGYDCDDGDPYRQQCEN